MQPSEGKQLVKLLFIFFIKFEIKIKIDYHTVSVYKFAVHGHWVSEKNQE